ncbi:MAG: hypothetical protein R3B84_04705 [Zavarzinella sp.]
MKVAPKYFSFHLLVLITFLCVGCSKDEKPVPKAQGNNATPAIVKPPETLATQDLSPFGIRADIQVPEGCRFRRPAQGKVVGEIPRSAFQFEIIPSQMALDDFLAPLKEQGATWETLGDIARGKIKQGDAESHFVVMTKKIGEQQFLLTSPIQQKLVDLENCDRIERSLKTMVQTDTHRQAEAAAQKKLMDLFAQGVVIQPGSRGLLMRMPQKAIPTASLDELSMLSGVVELEILENDWLTPEIFTKLAAIPGLLELSATGATFDDNCLTAFVGAKHLETLKLYHTSVSDNGFLGFMPKTATLKTIQVTNREQEGKITGTGFVPPADSELTQLWLPNQPITEAGLKAIGKIYSLQQLTVQGKGLTDAGFKELVTLRELTHMHISNTSMTDASWTSVGWFRNLQSLVIDGSKMRGNNTSPLTGLVELQNLSVMRSPVGDQFLSPLKGMNLLRLDLSFTDISDKGLTTLGNLVTLQHLALPGTRCTDGAFASISQLPNLTHLNMHTTGISGASSDVLENCKLLTKLNLENTLLSGDGLKSLAKVGSLSEVQFSDTALKDDDVPTLAEMKNLSYITLANTDISEAGFKALAAKRNDLSVLKGEEEPVSEKPEVKILQPVDQLPVADVKQILEKYSPRVLRQNNLASGELTSLDFTGANITDLELAHLRGQKELKKLVLNRCQKITDSGIFYLQKLPKLEEISLNDSSVSEGCLQILAKIPTLEAISLGNTEVRGSRINDLLSLQKLHTLDCLVVAEPHAALQNLSKLPKLTNLPRLGSGFNNRDIAALARLTNIEKLVIQSNQVIDGALAPLSECKNLKDVVLQSDSLTDGALVFLQQLPKLKSLELAGGRLTDQALKNIKNISSLERLNLAGFEVTNASLTNLTNLSHLISLNLRDTGVSDAGLSYLGALVELEELDLANTKVTDKGLRFLNQCVELRRLDLTNTAVNGKGFGELIELSRLRRLFLANTQINDDGMIELGKLVSLEELHVNGTQVTDTGIKKISFLKALAYLNLDNLPKITDAAVPAFAELRSLTRVSVVNTAITIKGVSELQKNPRLEVISK